MKHYKFIEVTGDRGLKFTINIKYIIEIRSYPKGAFFHMEGGYHIQTVESYQEVKDMIAACYGGEDEED